jgi:hypothetical protein
MHFKGLEGANNTKYFHLIANGKHRRKYLLVTTRGRNNYWSSKF